MDFHAFFKEYRSFHSYSRRVDELLVEVSNDLRLCDWFDWEGFREQFPQGESPATKSEKPAKSAWSAKPTLVPDTTPLKAPELVETIPKPQEDGYYVINMDEESKKFKQEQEQLKKKEEEEVKKFEADHKHLMANNGPSYLTMDEAYKEYVKHPSTVKLTPMPKEELDQIELHPLKKLSKAVYKAPDNLAAKISISQQCLLLNGKCNHECLIVGNDGRQRRSIFEGGEIHWMLSQTCELVDVWVHFLSHPPNHVSNVSINLLTRFEEYLPMGIEAPSLKELLQPNQTFHWPTSKLVPRLAPGSDSVEPVTYLTMDQAYPEPRYPQAILDKMSKEMEKALGLRVEPVDPKLAVKISISKQCLLLDNLCHHECQITFPHDKKTSILDGEQIKWLISQSPQKGWLHFASLLPKAVSDITVDAQTTILEHLPEGQIWLGTYSLAMTDNESGYRFDLMQKKDPVPGNWVAHLNDYWADRHNQRDQQLALDEPKMTNYLEKMDKENFLADLDKFSMNQEEEVPHQHQGNCKCLKMDHQYKQRQYWSLLAGFRDRILRLRKLYGPFVRDVFKTCKNKEGYQKTMEDVHSRLQKLDTELEISLECEEEFITITKTKTLKKLEVIELCLQSYPCKHSCLLTFDDGSEEEVRYAIFQIQKLTENHQIRNPPHFEHRPDDFANTWDPEYKISPALQVKFTAVQLPPVTHTVFTEFHVGDVVAKYVPNGHGDVWMGYCLTQEDLDQIFTGKMEEITKGEYRVNGHVLKFSMTDRLRNKYVK